MKKKWILCSLITIGLIFSITFALRGFLSAPPYHEVIPIEFGPSNTPLTYVKIEDKEYLLLIDMGSKFPISLNKDCLENLKEKTPDQMGTWKDLKGNTYEAPSYILPKVKIGNIPFNNFTAQQKNEDWAINATLWSENREKGIINIKQGSIGRPILKKLNLLLDYDQNIIFASNDRHKLSKAGYSLNKMTKVPFTMERLGITLNIETDLGIKRFALDTGCTVNVIRSSLLKDNTYKLGIANLPFYESAKFKVKGKDFGAMQFYLLNITPELNEIDGVLGTPFLYNRVVYIDFSKREIYIGDAF